MAQKKEYRSAVRSRRLIRQAFRELLEEKPFEKITITDIVTRADLNRSTFYAHYPDIHGVVEEIQEEIFTRNIELIRRTPYRNLFRDPVPYLTAMSEILRENIDLLRHLGHSENLHHRLDDFRRVMVDDILHHSDVPKQLLGTREFEIRIHFFMGGIMNTYQQWAEGKLDCSLEDISREIGEMILEVGAQYLEI